MSAKVKFRSVQGRETTKYLIESSFIFIFNALYKLILFSENVSFEFEDFVASTYCSIAGRICKFS